mmetsp:Transcript_95096/g.296025  ORF Transcript_95096/g.296025 Transcript_95096/m.296025 type:complete len:209 (+) Transcript_95096:74-700(+)|eukprot:CAMPEP_0204577072 /NCGR_PEP_ID=MMETSP0661-20131031/42132_1 /ASSEMBLY_ACC=CAM_ASM_000606 /TAXON_ID=109239 /ORGANISM="Alexandrium margalefi, Strain AMGDE01CS-322" /LENGTH=208 /DNA_ID=CAMNT_0051585875 /DNA_START=69 /DNA_END=695 /DNA_ORIENTATION=-
MAKEVLEAVSTPSTSRPRVFEKIHIVGGVQATVLAGASYQVLDLATVVFVVINHALLSGFAYQTAMSVLAAHTVLHVLTDFESKVPRLEGMTLKMIPLKAHAFGDFFTGMSCGFIGFTMDDSMGCGLNCVRAYRLLFVLFVLSGVVTLPRALQVGRDSEAKPRRRKLSMKPKARVTRRRANDLAYELTACDAFSAVEQSALTVSQHGA